MKRLAWTLLALAACGPAKPPTSVTLKNDHTRVELSVSPYSLTVFDANGKVRLKSLPGKGLGAARDVPTFKDQILPGWDGYMPSEKRRVHVTAGTLDSATGLQAQATLDAEGTPLKLSIQLDGPKVDLKADVDGATGLNQVFFQWELAADEHFFGLGERYATFDHRGHSLYSWTEEAGLSAQDENATLGKDNPYPNGPSMTYFPVPFFFSSRGHGVYLPTTRYTNLHLGSVDANAWSAFINGTSLPFRIYVHEKPLDTLDSYTADTGRPPVPTYWAWGPRRRINRGVKVEGVDEYQLMRDRKMPITAIDDAVHFLPQNSHFGKEAELKAWVDALHAAGFKALAYNNPYVSESLPSAKAEYEYGRANGLFEKAPDGKPATTFFISGAPQYISAIDLTRPEGMAWFKQLLNRTLELGYDGWMHDFGEYVERTSSFGDGRKGDEVHNEFPLLSVKAAYELIQEKRNGDAFFFARSGYAGSQKYAVGIWSGDPEVSFDQTQGLPAYLRGGLSLGLSGVPYWGSDINGFKCLSNAVRDAELYFRWVQMGAVSPIMMDQDACANPTASVKPTKWKLWNDLATQDVWRQMAGLHTRLAPYQRALAIESSKKGTPIMRPPVLFHPAREEAWKTDDAFFFGPSLYAAPVVKRGVRERQVWLPPGARYLEWTERTVHAGDTTAKVPAPLERLPLFLVENQLLPLLDDEVQTLAPATDPTVVTEKSREDVLDVVAALGPNGTASFTLADGTVLTATRSTGTSRTGFTEAAADAELKSCSNCFRTSASVNRARVNGVKATESKLSFEDLTLEAKGPIARRYRWDISRLP